MADDGNNQSAADRRRLNFIDSYPHTAPPSAHVVSAFINDTIAPAAAAHPQATSRAAASLLASVEGHGRHLHAQLRENHAVAPKDINAERTRVTLQDRWGAHPWVPTAYAPRPPIAPLIIRKMSWITGKVLSRPGATPDDLAALWAGSPRDPENAGLLLRALVTSGASNLTKTVATQAARMLEAELDAADADAAKLQRLRAQAAEERDWAEMDLLRDEDEEDDAAQRILALHEADLDEAEEDAQMLRLVQDAEEQLRQQRGEEEEEEEEETEGGRRYNEAFMAFSDNNDENDNDGFFGDNGQASYDNELVRPRPSPPMSRPLLGSNTDEDPSRVSPCAPAVRPGRGAVRSRPEPDSESDARPRQRRRAATTTSSSSSSSSSSASPEPESEPESPPAPARRVRRPRTPAANQQEEIERIAAGVYSSIMSQLRQGNFPRRVSLAARQDIAWHARAGVLDAAAAQNEGIAKPNNEPRAAQTLEDYLTSEDDAKMLTRPRRRLGALW